jgi:outer membrane scaffolding protein for murein synthesis (MipA/OmpV family)
MVSIGRSSRATAYSIALMMSLLTGASLTADRAEAQQAIFARWQEASGVVLRPLAGPVPDWSITLGGGVAALPAYEGSNSTRLVPAPTLDIRYKDLAFLSDGEGAGVNVLRGTNYRAGLGLTYDIGREHNQATRLSGTGNVDPAPVARLFAEYSFLPLIFTADLRQALTSYQGLTFDLGAYMPVFANETVQVFLGPGITFADSRYMEAYFGITPNHATPHSRFAVYHASGGVKNSTLGMSVLYHFNDHWFLDGTFGIERLLGSAADSPLVQTRWGMSAAGTLNYTF